MKVVFRFEIVVLRCGKWNLEIKYGFYRLFNYLCTDNQRVLISKTIYQWNKQKKERFGKLVVQGARFPILKLNNKIINHGKAFRSYLKI